MIAPKLLRKLRSQHQLGDLRRGSLGWYACRLYRETIGEVSHDVI
jgi:hypothetical protein